MTPNSESSCFVQTPSLLKWLLNERAAAAGELEKADQRIDRLHHKVTAAQARFQNAQAMLCNAELLRSRTANRLDALDRSIGLTYERVDPKAVGTVNVTGQKYGGRGGLKRFLLSLLKSHFPTTLPTPLLLDMVIAEFSLSVVTGEERRSMKQSVYTTLSGCQARGFVERANGAMHVNEAISWRWKATPTLDDLLRDLPPGSTTLDSDRDCLQDSTGREVGGQ